MIQDEKSRYQANNRDDVASLANEKRHFEAEQVEQEKVTRMIKAEQLHLESTQCQTNVSDTSY